MRNEPKEIETLVIGQVTQMLVETGDLAAPQVKYCEAPDFVISDGALTIGVELVSYHVDAVEDGNKIKSEKRAQWEKRRDKAPDLSSEAQWLGISYEVIELSNAKAKKLAAYKLRSACDEYWLIIHTENICPFEELGTADMASIQNVNFTGVIRHHLSKIPFERVYLYDIRNRGLFGGDVSELRTE